MSPKELQAFKDKMNQLMSLNEVQAVLQRLANLPPEIKGQHDLTITNLTTQYTNHMQNQIGGLVQYGNDPVMNQINMSVLRVIQALGAGAATQEIGNQTSTGNYTILFLASNPSATGKLRLDQEIREIQEGLQRSTERHRFSLEQRHAVRPADLSRAMMEVEPHIVHFSGHGVTTGVKQPGTGDNRALMFDEPKSDNPVELSGAIVVEDNSGKPVKVNAEALGGLFALFEGKIQCVVLNACYSETQASEIIKYVPYVIGMNTAVPDDTAIAFATGFYDAIGNGKDVPFAFKMANVRIMLEGMQGHEIPQLIEQ